MDIGLIIVLIVLNGIFAMSEMALISSGKARLQKLVEERKAGAKSAFKLHQEPSHFLSTIQVGITLVKMRLPHPFIRCLFNGRSRQSTPICWLKLSQ